jgi:hypothetical protein
MATLAELEQSLLKILSRLRPYLTDIVVIGGWVPQLYRRYGGFEIWTAEVSLTGELDALVAAELPAGDRPSIAAILSTAGFQPVIATPMAAVWANNPAVGEKIEFLVNHTGPFKTLGEIQPIAEQPGLGAIALEGLWFLRQHEATLVVPAGSPGVGSEGLQVHLPRLGAYGLNKAVTFSQRYDRREGGNPRRAKDLLYIRDLMAAGDEVVERIGADLRVIIESDRRSRAQARQAADNVRLLSAGTWREELSEAAEMLAERSRSTSPVAAMADIQGHLADLGELFKENGL